MLQVNVGLDLTNEATEGLEVVQLCVRENIGYLKVHDQTHFEAQQ